MNETDSYDWLKQVQQAVFEARLANITHLGDDPKLLADPSINPMDRQAAVWVAVAGRLPNEMELDLLDRNRWPEPVAKKVA